MLNALKRSHGDASVHVRRQLMHQEARLGGQLFGPVASGSRREFFCLDEFTWIWHEEWRDANGGMRAIVTRYDILPNGIRKAQDNQPYVYINESEARRLYAAVELYNQIIDRELAEELNSVE